MRLKILTRQRVGFVTTERKNFRANIQEGRLLASLRQIDLTPAGRPMNYPPVDTKLSIFVGLTVDTLDLFTNHISTGSSTVHRHQHRRHHLSCAPTLFFKQGTKYFDAKSKRYVDFPFTNILQMMGQAGHPQYDQHGKAIILVHEPKKSFYKMFRYEPFPVESRLREQLHDHINAEIVSGTFNHKEDVVHYLTWTYLFRRLVVPANYGLEYTDPGTLSSYLSSLVVSTFEDLEDSGCIKIDEERVEPMILGSIASQYYLKYTTLSMFTSNIGTDTSLEVFIHVLSGASEYDELPVRHNEGSYQVAKWNGTKVSVNIM